MSSLYKYICIHCDFKTMNHNHFLRHEKTSKHIKKKEQQAKTEDEQLSCGYYIDKHGTYICVCGKEYKLKSSLINHKRKCNIISESLEYKNTTTKQSQKNLENPKIEEKDATTMKIKQLEESFNKKLAAQQAVVFEMAAQQSAAQEAAVERAVKQAAVEAERAERSAKKDELMVEYMQKTSEAMEEIAKQPKTITNIDNRKIDNRVSINVFLNDQCKDAMNLVDFVNTIQCRLEDLEHIGKNGYIEGVSRLMIEGLQKMDITKRPIHCTDSKRDSLYIKDNDEWTKEDPTGGQMKKAIRKIANKGVQKIPEWQENNPTFNNLKSNTHEKYMGICGNLMGGLDDEEDNKNFKKITKRIASEVIIDKDMTTAITNDK